MKQLVQDNRTGKLTLKDVPPPQLGKGGVLVRTRFSLVSAGTERGQIEFAQKSLVGKALARPDLVAKVMTKAQVEGPLAAVRKALRRLDQPLALGYSSAGVVEAVADDIHDLAIGDEVACAGLGFASHAEFVFVPRNLCVKVPAGVTLSESAYVTLGAIALEGIRVADTRVGEIVAVIGLGLLGLLTVQLLKASGCRVLGIDPDPSRVALALELGLHTALDPSSGDLERQALGASGGYGADAVIVSAATPSSEPLELAAKIARDRACIVVVGITGMKVPRKPFYEKALVLRMSRAYGPGRYDRNYEERGQDYPIGYVRWTENRNMQAFLDILAQRRVDVQRLTTHRFAIEQALDAYDLIVNKKEEHIGVVLQYGQDAARSSRVVVRTPSPSRPRNGVPRIGVVGAGAFATGVILPTLVKCGVALRGIATRSGLTAERAAQHFGFEYCASDPQELLDDPDVDALIVLTRPDSHAGLTARALERGKHVFVEKPLATDLEQLRRVWHAYEGAGAQTVMVGFNRRYSPYGVRLREFFTGHRNPLIMVYRVNANVLEPGSWQLDPEQGGGRLIGECGHFVDLMSYVCGEAPVEVAARRAGGEDVTLTVSFAAGSVGTLTYTASGSERFSKERLEVFGDGRVGVLDDFRRLELVAGTQRKRFSSRLAQDKGHDAELQVFANALRGRRDSIAPFLDAVLVTLATVQASEAIRAGVPRPIGVTQLD